MENRRSFFLSALLAGETDIAITHIRPSQQELVILKLFEPKVAWICSSRLCPAKLKKAIASASSIPWELSLALPWIAYREQDNLLNHFIETTGLQAVRDSLRLTLENWLTLRELVEAGKGCAVVPGEILTSHNTQGLTRIDLDPPEGPQSFFAVYRRELAQTSKGKALIASLRSRDVP